MFGSALGDAFDPAFSDVELLVEFDLRAGFDYVGSAVRAADLVGEFTGNQTFADCESDAMLRSAVERQFEIVGEA